MKSPDQNNRPSLRPYLYAVSALSLLVGAGLGAATYRVFFAPQPDWRSSQLTENVPNFTKNGQQINVPDNSPLRGKLLIDAVSQKEVQRTLVLPAVVEADPARLVKVLPPLPGRITQLKVQLGQPVEAGQALATLESSDLRTAYADYDRAKYLLALATKNRDRLRGLGKSGGIAEKDIQQAETDFLTADAEFQRAEARLRQIGAAADSANTSRVLTISSPISGSVIDLAVAPGSFWNDPNSALMTIADLATVWVTANVPEKDISLVAKDQKVEVRFAAYPGEVLEGRVLFVSQVLDPDTRRARVRISFTNPDDHLKPGMFANVTFFARPQTVTMVPTTALVLKNDANRVFVEVAPWMFEPRPVKTGFQQGDQTVIQEGLKAGDRIIVRGGVLLND